MKIPITYHKTKSPDVSITSARFHLPLFGCWCDTSLSVYHVPIMANSSAISFGIRPLTDPVRGDSTKALPQGTLWLSRGNEGNRQNFQQILKAPIIMGRFMDMSELLDGEEDVGRMLFRLLHVRAEQVAESIRLWVRKHVGREVFDHACGILHERYHAATVDAVQSFLTELHWQFMLSDTGLTELGVRVLETELKQTPLRCFPVTESKATGIDPVVCSETIRFNLADAKATALLRTVCGDVLADEFLKTGGITFESHGYKFHVCPNKFVDCTDPFGKRAGLCIHTLGFACNPIDEVCLAYLHLKHNFREYMDKAIVQRPQAGFTKDAA